MPGTASSPVYGRGLAMREVGVSGIYRSCLGSLPGFPVGLRQPPRIVRGGLFCFLLFREKRRFTDLHAKHSDDIVIPLV